MKLLLRGENVFLRPFDDWDAESLTRMIIRNKDFWGRKEPEWPAEYYTLEGQRQNIKNFRNGIQNDLFYTFGIFSYETYSLSGMISLYELKRGPFQSAVVGYSVDKRQTGKGYAAEGLRLLVAFAFEYLQLNRIKAEVMPQNYASIRVLEKTGFLKEGTARENIYIQGKWINNLQYSLLWREWALKK